MAEGDRDRHSPALIGPAVILLLLVAGAVLVLGTEGTPSEHRASVETATPPTPLQQTEPPVDLRVDYAPDGIPIKPQDPRVPDPEGPMHPHPITPEHERIFRENNLVGELNGAMDVGDVAGMRKLLEQYRREYPEDSHLLQQGFAVIADCLEHPGDASTAAARAYYSANKASNIRRYVRRHCFER